MIKKKPHQYSKEEYKRQRDRALHQKKKFAHNSKAMQFIRHQNWDALKEEFFDTIKDDGTFFYQTAAQFSKVKFKDSISKRQLLSGAIGAQPTFRVPWQGNWEMERWQKSWRSDKKVEALRQAINGEIDAAKVAQASAPVFMDYVSRFERLQAQVDSLFDGGQLINGAKPEVNAANIREYLTFSRKIMKALSEATEYMITAMGGQKLVTLSLLAKLSSDQVHRQLGDGSTDTNELGSNRTLMQLVAAVETKARMFGVSLPGGQEEKKQTLEVKAG